ncbi:MAG: alpha-amylase family protein [Phycisphaerae bacterium]|jgi:hypothetical protein
MPRKYPARLRRSESFLGVHFDFHASDDCTEVGKTVTPRMIEAIIDAVGPDYLQTDCKGHRGLSSYPTKVGAPAPGFVKDTLRIWRDVTARRGVALFMHYSGVWDTEMVRRHPNWARVDEAGKAGDDSTCVFGPYVDELMIPQLKELCDVYGVDGVWVDGDCWAVKPDYNPLTLEKFRAETGIQNVPHTKDEPHYHEFLQFNREGFRRYVRRYVDAMHAHNKDFQVASNWAFTSFMPEPVSIGVDFISGDYAPSDAVNSARYEGRCMAPQGKPWDLMAWGFSRKGRENCYVTKSVPQLQREAAVVLALGGGFQAYFTQNRDGSVNLWQMEVMGEVARFCRARQKFCHQAVAVPQIALLNSTAGFYRHKPSPFGGGPAAVRGTLQALLAGGQSVEILNEHHLRGRMDEYPLIVVPEWEHLEKPFIDELLAYANRGGKLLIVGPGATALFAEPLGIASAEAPESRDCWVEHEGRLGGMVTRCQKVTLGGKAKAFGKLYLSNNISGKTQIAASIARCGKGRIAGVHFDFGERFSQAATPVTRDFLNAMVRELFPEPIVELSGSHLVDVSVNRIGGKLAINLVNAAGPHDSDKTLIHDEIPVLHGLELTLRLPGKPRKITAQPGNRKLAFKYAAGKARVKLPPLEIHDVIVVE